MRYIKQLDGIRAIAVGLVIITHWFPETHWLNISTSVFNGVDIFFCLSGFLITGILLENKKKAVDSGTRTISIVKSFYMRRFLRIFPIYYLTILFLYIIASHTGTGIRANVMYFLTYTSNFYFFKIKFWDGILSPYWSLAVEEQFYLIWPWMVLYIADKYVLPLILLFLITGICAQYYFMHVNFSYVLTPCCFDGFGLGALLAWALIQKPVLLKYGRTPLAVLAAISFILQIAFVVSHGKLFFIPSRTLTSICTLWVINSVLLQQEKKSVFLNRLLGNPVLVFIGKISYGIYVYHLLPPNMTTKMFTFINSIFLPAAYGHNAELLRLEYFCCLLLGAYLSWKLVEQPILQFKSRFQYLGFSTSSYPKEKGLRQSRNP